MAIILENQQRQQRPQQEKQGILELLARGLAQGAGQSLGTGLGQLTTQGIGMLLDPNMRTLDAKTLEALGLDSQQAQAVASIRNPAIQRSIIESTQQRQSAAQEAEQKQKRTGQYVNAVNTALGLAGSTEGELPGPKGITQEAINDLEIADLDKIFKIGQKERLAAQGHVRESWKSTEKSRSKARETAESAEKSEGVLNRMEQLEKSGKLQSGPLPKILADTHLDYFLSPESQEFQKLSASFMAGAQKAVGGRVTNFELENFMKTVPNLMQSPEGRKRIINNMKAGFELDKKYYQVMRDIIKEHKGKALPNDFDEQVYDRMKPYYTQFQNKFETSEQPVEKKAQATFESRPLAAQFSGKKIRDKETGQIFISNGTDWIPVNQQQVAQQAQQSKKSVISNPFQVGEVDYGEF